MVTVTISVALWVIIGCPTSEKFFLIAVIHTSPFIITYYWSLLREVSHVWFVVVGCFDAYNINSATFPYIIEGLSALCVLRQEVEQLRMGNKMTCWIHRSRPFRWFICRRFSCCYGGVNGEFTFSHILPIAPLSCLWRRNYELWLGGEGAGGYRLPAQNENPKSQSKSCSPIPLLLWQICWLTKNLSLLCV